MLPILLQFLLLVISTLLSFNAKVTCAQAATWNPKQHPYPKVPRGNKVWSYKSAKLGRNDTFADPYYALEKPLDTDPEVIKFIDQQTQLSDNYINGCKSKDKIAKDILDAQSYNDYQFVQLISQAAKPFYLYRFKTEKDNRPSWYTCTPNEMEAARKTNMSKPPGKKFLDETLLSVNSTVNIQYTFISNDGQYFAYYASDASADVANIYLRKFTSPLIQAKTFPPGGEGAMNDVIYNVDGNSGFVWTKDSTGFFYVQVNDDQGGANADVGSTVRYHKVGTAFEKDVTVVHPDKVGPDGKQNYWFVWSDTNSKWLFVMGLNDITSHGKAYATIYQGQTISDQMKWISISPDYIYKVQWIDVIKDVFYYWTDKDAVDGKVVKSKLDWSKARSVKDLSQLKDQLPMTDIIAEVKFSKIMYNYAFGGDKVLLVYITDGRYVSKLFNFITGKLLREVLPNEPGLIYNAIADKNGIVVFYAGTFSPLTIYRIDFKEGKYSEILLTQQAIKGTNPNDFLTEHLFATSKDGTRVPYAIQYHKRTKKDGKAVAWMRWYAANGHLETYLWDAGYFSWIRSYNTIYVWVSARGGGDRGEHWHQAGQNHNRQNAYDDIIAVAQDLVKRNLTSFGNIIGEAGSAGGMAAAVIANQAPPGLFGVLFPERAVCDVLLSQRSRGGSAQTAEYGDIYNPIDYDYIRAWSPLQNVQKHKYPAILLEAGDSDDRVVAAHSFKFLAELQFQNPNNPAPMMLYLARSAGHKVNDLSTDAYTAEFTFQQCFAELALGLKRVE